MPETVALVTGAHGFLGRHVARALAAAGHSVRGLGHGSWPEADWRAWGLSAFASRDVTFEGLASFAPEPAVVVHCAGSASVQQSVAQPMRDFERTVGTTVAVLEYLRVCAPEARLLLPSSGSVYGSVAAATVSESAPLMPQSPYASHKLLAEGLCASWGRSFGIRSAVVRFFSLYGPGLRKQLLWDACTRLTRGESSFAGSGEEMRDFLHVDDATRLLLQGVAHASPTVPIVNGGTGSGATVREVITALGRALGLRPALTFTGERRPGDPFRFVADNGCARSWGWTPRVELRQGLVEYAAWFARGAP